jgi:GAF domain-containing protein
MERNKKQERYQRLYDQGEGLMAKSENELSRMATIIALLHHKMKGFFWTGFYLIQKDGRLCVGPYQGPVACQELAKNTGVCWAAVNDQKPVIVGDVNQFPGHIACDSRSKSEITLPVRDRSGNIVGVLDVDSNVYNNFDETDANELSKILTLINV